MWVRDSGKTRPAFRAEAARLGVWSFRGLLRLRFFFAGSFFRFLVHRDFGGMLERSERLGRGGWHRRIQSTAVARENGQRRIAGTPASAVLVMASQPSLEARCNSWSRDPRLVLCWESTPRLSFKGNRVGEVADAAIARGWTSVRPRRRRHDLPVLCFRCYLPAHGGDVDGGGGGEGGDRWGTHLPSRDTPARPGLLMLWGWGMLRAA